MMGLSFCVGWAHSLQGDIAAIVDSAGNLVVEYKYDAWGNITHMFGSLSGTLGEMNPFRYRGYVYDVESGLYYLRSRYYNPEWGRFINADSQISAALLMANPFVYCSNNPIRRCDSNGTNWFIDTLLGIGAWFQSLFQAQAESDAHGTQQNATNSNSISGNSSQGSGTNGNWFTQGLDAQLNTDLLVHEVNTRIIDKFINGGMTILSRIGNALDTGLQAQRESNVISIQMSYYLADNAYVAISNTPAGAFVIDRFSTPEKAANSLDLLAYGLGGAAAATLIYMPELSLCLGILAFVCEGMSIGIAIFEEE